MYNNIKNIEFKPYEPCSGRYCYVPRTLYRPLVIWFETTLCNYYLNDKNKLRFIKQLLRWFNKDRSAFKIDHYLKIQKSLSKGDLIYLSCRTQKAGWRKLLAKLNFQLVDYNMLKKRSYGLFFIFLIVEENSNKNITLDIEFKSEDNFFILITISTYYLKELEIFIN